MKHHVEIHQLSTEHGAYLNVLEGQGYVGVWGFAAPGVGTVHYFLRNKEGHFAVVVFDTEEWAKDWLRDNEKSWPLAIRMTRVTP
jgi:hypothetical protein